MREEKAAWVSLKPGVKVLRLWESVGPEKPEIAILWLSGAQYREFARDPKQFLNANHLFPKDVNRIIAKSELSPKEEDVDIEWLVMPEHDPGTSDCAVTSMYMFKP